MEDYGFSSGLMSRVYRKILPLSPEQNTVEYILTKTKNPIATALELVDLEREPNQAICKELDLSIVAICSKIVAFGLDHYIRNKLIFIAADAEAIDRLAAQLNTSIQLTEQNILELKESLDNVECTVINLRKNKNKIGTNLHLTIVTRRTLEYIWRAKELLDLKLNINSKTHWENLFLNYISYDKKKNSISRFVGRHADLVVLEVIEHTAKQGEKYIAENRKEYMIFFYRSLLGGGLISLFALVKIMVESNKFSQLSNAWYYSVNYALCFVIVKLVGGIIATKQPAMTASTIAKNIDKNNDLELDSVQNVIHLDRKVFSTQFISLFGNFLMAFLLSCFIALIVQIFNIDMVTNAINPKYLMKQNMPTTNLIMYSAIAGFYLAFSGLISGYFDNKVVASNVAYRIRESKLFFKSVWFSNFMDKKSGALVGNISLGFFLGCTFLLSNFSSISFDIRHIAFSSANLGYAIVNGSFSYKIILFALAGVFITGMVNFLVSFSITLFLTLKSRGARYDKILSVFLSTLVDFIKNPKEYIKIPKGETNTTAKDSSR